MDGIFKHNVANLVISTLAILCAYCIELGSILFWYGGLLVIPAIAVWFQFKFALGCLRLRLSVAVAPWLVLCLSGLLWASKASHEGQRAMNMLFFEMPLYSILIGALVVTIRFIYKKFRERG
ncbi:hypothetical protein CWB99_20335 [Pseudoalteromonas rubra]|uniref:Uncharacterized protein n=1 Tax=Pseudoalteromonas rubra TaxID=43658 RepID=A0A5S3WHW6_9GAMM|nr:hypothetical protein CWB99_20335 [Pseudoalteromonas rubra]TMP29780.1 hypothetical protein CWC00_18135 [Pseudoalteromonas rubra]